MVSGDIVPWLGWVTCIVMYYDVISWLSWLVTNYDIVKWSIHVLFPLTMPIPCSKNPSKYIKIM